MKSESHWIFWVRTSADLKNTSCFLRLLFIQLLYIYANSIPYLLNQINLIKRQIKGEKIIYYNGEKIEFEFYYKKFNFPVITLKIFLAAFLYIPRIRLHWCYYLNGIWFVIYFHCLFQYPLAFHVHRIFEFYFHPKSRLR